MGRPAKIWKREADGFWYATHRGEKVKLAADKAEAEKAFHTLKAHDAPPEPEVGPRPSVKHLVGLYLDQAKLTKKPDTYEVQRRILVNFCDYVGNKKAPDIRVPAVKDWLAADKPRRGKGGTTTPAKWGESMRALAGSTVIALFNWAVEEQRLSVSPVKGLKRGRYLRRERIVPPEHRAAVMGAAGPELADFLRLMALTGARPFSELGVLTAAAVDFTGGLVVPVEHKTAKKGKARVIVLVPEAVDILRRLAGRHPAGLLLRTGRGRAWSRQTFNAALKRAAKRAGVPEYSPYDWRRTFITDGLAGGLSANVMAQLAGNTPAVINKYYDSLHLRLDALRAAAATAAGG